MPGALWRRLDTAFVALVALIAVALVLAWAYLSQVSSHQESPPVQVAAEDLGEADWQYLNAVQPPIQAWTSYRLIDAGERVCGALSEGSSLGDVRTVLMGRGLTSTEADAIMRAAVTVYCPSPTQP